MEQLQSVVDEVNVYRCMHGSAPLKLSEELSQNTYDHFQGATEMEHSDSYAIEVQYGGPSGENLAWGSPSLDPVAAVGDWYKEIEQCAGFPDQVDGCQESVDPSLTVGHFTALVWDQARTLGCAMSDNGQILACRFGNNLVCDGEQSDLPCTDPNAPPNCRCELFADTPNMDGSYANNVYGREKDEETCRAEIMSQYADKAATSDAPSDATLYADPFGPTTDISTEPYDPTLSAYPY